MRHSLAIPFAIVAIAAGCGEKKAATDTTQTAATGASTAAAPSNAGVMFMSPAKGSTTGADVTVSLMGHGVTIAKADGSKSPGVGHYHLFLDTIPTPDDKPIPPTSAKIVHLAGDSTYTFKGLTPGEHRIIAVLGYGDHTPMPGARDTVTFTVKP